MNREHVVEEIDHRGLTVKIYNDLEPESPREWDNLGTMVAFHSRYSLGDKDHGFTVEELIKFIGYRLRGDPIIALPLYLYDHGNVAMSTSRNWPFDCRWDSMQVGYIFVEKTKVRQEYGVKRISPKLREAVEKRLEGEVQDYSDYLSGDVYGYVVEDAAGNHLDSCWGYYGFDYCLEEGKSMADWHAEKFKQEKEATHAKEIELHEVQTGQDFEWHKHF